MKNARFFELRQINNIYGPFCSSVEVVKKEKPVGFGPFIILTLTFIIWCIIISA